MTFRKPCEHGRYDEHATKDGKYWPQVKMLQASKYPAATFTICPGGPSPSNEELLDELRQRGVKVARFAKEPLEYPERYPTL